MKYLTSGDVVEIIQPIGVTAKQFAGWCERELIVSTEGGGTKGNHRQFTLMQTVGIAVASKIFKSDRGCVASYVGMVVQAFGAKKEEDLLEQFKKKATHLMMVVRTGSGLHLELTGAADDRVDVKATYNEVVEAVAKLSNEPANPIGRNRGLVSTSCEELAEN
jgi:hypothetical protein